MSKERAAQLVDAGIWLKLSGDREGARKLFERALKLDPDNAKAAQLLSGADEPTAAPMPSDLPVAPSIAPISDGAANPFEPPAASPPSPTQRDWNLATSKGVPSQPEPSLDADWGRLTGASTPVPQQPPAGSEAAPRNTIPFGSNQSGVNIVIGSNTPAPAPPPPAVSSPSSPRNPTMMQWNSPTPQRIDSPPSSSGSSPGLKRQTMSDWGTQVGGSSDSPPPIAPVVPKSSGSSPGTKSVRQTISEWGDAPAGTPKSSGSSGERRTISEWGDVPAGAPKSSGSSPGVKRQTMSDWGTQVGSFDSPPPIRPVLPVEDLPAPVPPQTAEPARSTLHEWSGSSSSSVAMKPLFSGPASTDSSPLMSPSGGLTVNLGGEAPPEVPPPSTPPLFGFQEEPPTPAQMDELPLPTPQKFDLPMQIESPRTFTEPMGFAWSWSASQSPPPQGDPPPEPRPSPSLMPRAESAWDQRSNPGIKLEAVVGRDKALDLISSDSKPNRQQPTKKEEVTAILRGAKDLLELDDHTGAMELIQKAESIAPDDPEVIGMRERSEKTLLTMFESKLGKLEAIPRVLLKDDEIIWLNLDHRAGFVLAQIDGTVSFDDLFSVSGMTRIDTARILAQLVEEGVISRG